MNQNTISRIIALLSIFSILVVGSLPAMAAGPEAVVQAPARSNALTADLSRTKQDFDHDGDADLAIYRPATGVWYVKDQFQVGWGIANDMPVPGDYDDDGDTDVAVYRPSTGVWYVKDQFQLGWGIPSDIPVPGDYNADGRTDIAVFRPSNGVWYVKDQFSVGFGDPTDIPVPGDYNNDGDTDVAVYRPSTGVWYIKDQFQAGWGIPGDIPVPGDYDNDGDTDVAVYRPSNGVWYVKDQFSAGWGIPNDVPIPGDYNGDGRTDVAVYRPSNGVWYVKDQFSAGWGADAQNDFPLPSRWTTEPWLLSPGDGTAIAKTTFDWYDVSGATSYQFQLSSSNSFGSFVVNQNVSQSQYSYTSSLTGTYYWRVYAVNSLGVTPEGGESTEGNGPIAPYRSVSLVNYNNDDDGDELPNGWELHGYDAGSNGTIDVNLPALGANYRHKDIFVEMDYMVNGSNVDFGPTQEMIDEIESVFSEGAISNPDGVSGINIHLEKDDQVPFDSYTTIWTEFDAIKASYFDPNRAVTHHYMIWANQYADNQSSGVARGIPATDFLVSIGSWNSEGGTFAHRVGTFIHELGHNLGLTHGGNDHVNYKPNYLSVMNYIYQFWGVYRDGTYEHWDYQRINLPSLNENSLNETTGLTGSGDVSSYGVIYDCPSGYFIDTSPSSVDWDCDGDGGTDTNTSYNLNPQWDSSKNTLGTQNNWANIVFDGGGAIGSGASPQDVLNGLPQDVPPIEEATLEIYLELEQTMQNLQVAP